MQTFLTLPIFCSIYISGNHNSFRGFLPLWLMAALKPELQDSVNLGQKLQVSMLCECQSNESECGVKDLRPHRESNSHLKFKGAGGWSYWTRQEFCKPKKKGKNHFSNAHMPVEPEESTEMWSWHLCSSLEPFWLSIKFRFVYFYLKTSHPVFPAYMMLFLHHERISIF